MALHACDETTDQLVKRDFDTSIVLELFLCIIASSKYLLIRRAEDSPGRSSFLVLIRGQFRHTQSSPNIAFSQLNLFFLRTQTMVLKLVDHTKHLGALNC